MTVLHEHRAVRLDLAKYLEKVPYTQSDLARKLEVTGAQLATWKREGRLPVAVWERLKQLFGNKQMRDPKQERVHRPFRLPASYAELLGVVLEPAAPAPAPEPPPAPATVPYDVFQAAVLALMHQNSAILAEKAIIESDNQRLYKVIALFKAEIGFDVTVNAIGQPAQSVQQTLANIDRLAADGPVMEELKKLSPFNGNGRVVADLEQRLQGFPNGAH